MLDLKKMRKTSLVKTVRQKLNEDRKQTCIKHKWEVGLIFVSAKAKSTRSTTVITQFLDFVLNNFCTLDFCLHATSSSSKVRKGPSAGGSWQNCNREAERHLLVECTSLSSLGTLLQSLLNHPFSLPILVDSDWFRPEALLGIGLSPSVICHRHSTIYALSMGAPTTSRKEAKGSVLRDPKDLFGGLFSVLLEYPRKSAFLNGNYTLQT